VDSADSNGASHAPASGTAGAAPRTVTRLRRPSMRRGLRSMVSGSIGATESVGARTCAGISQHGGVCPLLAALKPAPPQIEEQIMVIAGILMDELRHTRAAQAWLVANAAPTD
jgi:hypothetical protein